MDPARGRRGAARPGGTAPLRGDGPLLPLALRAALQLRADVGTPGRVDLLGPLRGGPAVRRHGLRARPAGPRRRRSDLVRGRPQGDGPLLDVGAARRARARREPFPAARGRAGAAAPRGPARLPPQPDLRHSPLQEVRGEAPRRPPDAGRAVRQALDRRIRGGPRQLDRPRPRGARVLRRRRAARPRGGRRGRPHAGPRRGGARGGGHSLARQRRLPRRLEPGVDRLEPRLPRGREAGRLRAVDADGAVLPARLERDRGRGRPGLPGRDRRAASRGDARDRAADRDRVPDRQGMAVRHRGQGVARRRAQALLRGLLPRPGRALVPHRVRAAELRGLGPSLRDGPGRRRGDGGVLLRRAAAGAPGGGERPRRPRRRWRRGFRPRASGSTPAAAGPAPAHRAWRPCTSSPARDRRSRPSSR